MVEKRLRHGEYIAMSPEEKIEHKRLLQRRWRHNHPEWVKTSNKKWSDIYRESKPFKCVCVKCGAIFGAARSHLKLCPECLAKRRANAEMRRNAQIERQNIKNKQVADIIEMARQGIPQTKIAEITGRTQSGISAILRNFGIRKKKLTRRN